MIFVLRLIAAFLSSTIAGVVVGDFLSGIFIFLPIFILVAVPVSLFVDKFSKERKSKQRMYIMKLFYYLISGVLAGCLMTVMISIGGDFTTVDMPSVVLITLCCSMSYYHFLLLLKKWLKWYKNVPLPISK
ncbi:hypothetical protein [Pseudalkalibacillus hwajinpoensis]|uniref:hypothetical protein n=1 Tax=Guptibacillus hwajinpoensis TaxID=208199 RepID=UPI001CD3339D|nr:hypothetical protein [Pseudalkalibacillus hwajinpoensis]MCA0993406.1 hypothetical protein [Pseudalkalibacillus hwajinpoensis]